MISTLIDRSPSQRADPSGVRLPAAGNRPTVGDVRRSPAPGQGQRGNQAQPGGGAHRGAGFPGETLNSCVHIYPRVTCKKERT